MAIKHADVKVTGNKGYASEWNKDHVIDSDVDFNLHQMLQAAVENRTDWPAGPVEGQIIFRSDQHVFYHWNGTSWIALGPVATVVVAADGSGQFTDIQDGIDALPAGGGVVYIREGTYTITASITFPHSNIAIIGAGKATQIVASGPCPPGAILFISGVGNIIVRDLYLYPSYNCDYGIVLSDVSYGYISGVWIDHANAFGIVMAATTHDISISSCFIHGCAIDGIFAINSGIRISDCSIDGNFAEGIELRNSDSSTITGNLIYGNGDRGIILWDDSDDNIIIGNSSFDNIGNDIEIFSNSCDRNIILGNNVDGTGGGIVDNGNASEVAHNIL